MLKLAAFCFMLFLVSVEGYSQTDTIQYFDAMDRRAHIDNAAYYRKISKPDTGKLYLGTEYWMDGHIKMVGYALDSNFLYKIGRFSYYYKNGTKSGRGQYYSDMDQHVFGYKNKKWEIWYPNGKPKEVWIYKIAEDFTYNESFLFSFWDSTGTELTSKGNGRYYYTEFVNTKDSLQKITFTGVVHQGRYDSIWHGYYANGKEYAEELYGKGKLIKGKSFDGAGNSYTYDTIVTLPEFPGGEEELNRFLKLNIQAQPEENSEIQQRVVVHVFVGRNGFVGNVSVVRGSTTAKNAEALRVVKSLPRFLPATSRGQPVDSYYNVPVSFNLP